MKQNVYRWFGWILLAAAVGATGCQSTDQADTGSMVSVAVPGHTAAEIQQMTATVFLLNGYERTESLTFEKQGTGWDTAAYGGWSAGPVWIKVRVHITPLKVDDCILSCNAYIVTDRNQPSMEQEQKHSHARQSECKKILDQIKARLDSPAKNSAQ